MANSISSALNVPVLAADVLDDLGQVLSPFADFTTNFSAYKKGVEVIEVPKIGSTGLQKNASSFGDEDSSVEDVQVTVDLYSKGFYLTSDQLQSGRELRKLFRVKAIEFAEGLMGVVTDVMTPANFQTSVADAAAMDKTDLTATASDIKGMGKVCLLQSSLYSTFVPTTGDDLPLSQAGVYGFHKGVKEVSDFQGTDVVGFAGSPSSIAISGGLPINNADEGVESAVISLDDIGMDVLLQVWYDRNAKAVRADYSVLFGASKGIAAAGAVILDPAEDA